MIFKWNERYFLSEIIFSTFSAFSVEKALSGTREVDSGSRMKSTAINSFNLFPDVVDSTKTCSSSKVIFSVALFLRLKRKKC